MALRPRSQGAVQAILFSPQALAPPVPALHPPHPNPREKGAAMPLYARGVARTCREPMRA